MTTVIRPAGAADWQALWQLASDTGVYLPEPEDKVWLAEIAGSPVGFIACCVAAAEMSVLGIAVGAEYRRQGIAQVLHGQACQALQPECAFLEVRRSNLSAQNLYTRLGYRKIGERKDYYRTADGGCEDAVTMRCDFGG